MAVKTKTSIKSFFQAGDKPTSGQFEHLVDSYLDFDPTLLALVSAAQDQGQTGMVVIEATAAVTTRSLGAGVIAFLAADTTAAARNALELGTIATADSFGLNQLANQPAGSVLVFNTTGSAVTIGGTTGQLLVSQGSSTAVFRTFGSVATSATVSAAGVVVIATTADTLAGTGDRVPTVAGMKAHQGVVKAWCHWNASIPTIFDSYNIASVAENAAGFSHVTFTVPFAASTYAASFMCRAATDTTGIMLMWRGTIGFQTGAGCKIQSENLAGTEVAVESYAIWIGDQ